MTDSIDVRRVVVFAWVGMMYVGVGVGCTLDAMVAVGYFQNNHKF